MEKELHLNEKTITDDKTGKVICHFVGFEGVVKTVNNRLLYIPYPSIEKIDGFEKYVYKHNNTYFPVDINHIGFIIQKNDKIIDVSEFPDGFNKTEKEKNVYICLKMMSVK